MWFVAVGEYLQTTVNGCELDQLYEHSGSAAIWATYFVVLQRVAWRLQTWERGSKELQSRIVGLCGRQSFLRTSRLQGAANACNLCPIFSNSVNVAAKQRKGERGTAHWIESLHVRAKRSICKQNRS